ncbi:outer membrane beta-barrel protein [Phreatobacter stygius]|uniref:outer membrane beta-barrel protein n=1 Tax=Phreatobacter stygius TaxID=1940610 RepID=UPI00147763D1|nr:outer membrane beta-barrel protein [Phreatobacter stygius]
MAPEDARAADPPALPALPPAGGTPWAGPYLGVHFGGIGGSGGSGVTGIPDVNWAGGDPAVPAAHQARSAGFIGGGQIGAHIRIGPVVLGLEQDFSVTTLSPGNGASGMVSAGLPYASSFRQKLDWLATTRLRLGVTPTERLLLYVTGGLAYGQVNVTSSVALPDVTVAGADRDLRVGWAAGAGLDYALTQTLSARLEYLYYDLGGTALFGFASPAVPLATTTRFGLTGHILRAGLNYRLDPAAIGARAFGPARATSDFAVETGLRYWYSSGSTANDLHYYSRSDLASRLTYGNLGGHAAESFFRVDHRPSGWFVKGFAGTGKIGAGRLQDEDFPPFITPYSSTVSDLKDGRFSYFSADIGYSFLQGPGYRLGGFVGYHFLGERLNAMGCRSTTSNICPPGQIPGEVLVITQKSNWHSLRLGLTGDLMFTDRLKLTAEAAWLPFVALSATDSHWLRINPFDLSGPIPETGTGRSGLQLEAVLSYQMTPAFSIGVGGRYWRMATTGRVDAAKVEAGGFAQPQDFRTERYGGFVQAAARF